MMSFKAEDRVLTRQQRAEYAATAFQYVIEELFNQELDGPVAQSLFIATENTEDIGVVLDLSEEDINNLHYFKSSDESESVESDTRSSQSSVRVALGAGYKGSIRQLLGFEEFRQQQGNPILPDWSNVTGDEFDYYRSFTNDINVSTPAPPQFLPPNSKPNNPTNNGYSPVEQFKRGIKRDMDHFMVLKSKRDFKSWHSNLLSIAATQDVEEILYPTYVPSTADTPLFKEKQKYMYAVAVKTLKTDIGVKYVGAHEND